MHQSEQTISNTIRDFADGSLRDSTVRLLSELGYTSNKVLPPENNNLTTFIEWGKAEENVKDKQIDLLRQHWDQAEIVFQITDDEIQESTIFSSTEFDQGRIQSFLFVAVDLSEEKYTRGKLAEMTRIVNKIFKMPVIMFYRYGKTSDKRDLTTALIHRRPHLRDHSKDVLEKVTLIKDIRVKDPHRAHLDILQNLSLKKHKSVKNFDQLHDKWESVLDTKPLNRQFYQQLFEWFERAVSTATWPTGVSPEQQVIRCVTRILFVWFMKEKGLVSEEWFSKSKMRNLLHHFGGSDYYQAVLQNLFFATLNVPMEKRSWTPTNDGDPMYTTSHWRYQILIDQVEHFEELMAQTPFINGGLFDCLDDHKNEDQNAKKLDMFNDDYLMDGASESEKVFRESLNVPDDLFFGASGLFTILNQYKFTVEENTPTEIDVALDPELLGLVFENLLASYNPETRNTARNETGSFYTPRNIVNYMVDEVIITLLSKMIKPVDGNIKSWENRLRSLFDYEIKTEEFSDLNKKEIVRFISELKILDPAVGSGAFPMTILHKLTYALRQLDQDNSLWRSLQQDRAKLRSDKAFETIDKADRDEELIEISNIFENYSGDYGRKIYLIQNSIYGIDIQAIACQITKLRFFISLIIEQESDQGRDNYGIKPLPNLETRFVAADSLMKLISEGTLNSEKIIVLQKELLTNRERYFHANSTKKKQKCELIDSKLRSELVEELKVLGFPPNSSDQLVSWNPYDQNNIANWFDPQYMFGIEDGFNIVIGNPPYRSLQKDGGKLGKLYKDAGYRTFARTGDIYQLFYERSCELLKDQGILAFITSNSWLRANYGKKLRNYLSRHSTPLSLLDVGKDVFEADVDTCILFLQNSPNDHQNEFKGIDLDRIGTHALPPPQNQWGKIRPNGNDIWRVLSDCEWCILEKMFNKGTPLKEWKSVSIYRGITTGLNEAFIVDQATKDRLIAEDSNSAEILKPVLRGRDIQRYHANWAHLWIITTFPSRNLNINRYPAIKRYLLTHGKSRLEQTGEQLPNGVKSRKKTPHQWFELQDTCAYHDIFSQEKLFWITLSTQGRFAYCNQPEFFCVDSAFILTGEHSKILSALLNSSLIQWFITYSAPTSGMGVLQWKKTYLQEIPVPLNIGERQPLIALIDQILRLKDENPNSDISSIESEIDNEIFNLFELTSPERNLITQIH